MAPRSGALAAVEAGRAVERTARDATHSLVRRVVDGLLDAFVLAKNGKETSGKRLEELQERQ